MRVHFLGICGTFMAGLAVIAKALGWEVSGSDEHSYPPMSDILSAAGIIPLIGYDHPQFFAQEYDCVVIGNVLSRGNPAIEFVLQNAQAYCSGPQWLFDQVLFSRHVLAVAGTHGKTTTTAMLAWILQQAGLNPSFLIGGAPRNFPVSARLTDSEYFVIEADEYDTAFFDKRPKFLHYHPKTLVLNNLEYDHADIYDNFEHMKLQYHYLLRTVPANGQIITNAEDDDLAQVLAKGLWSRCVDFGLQRGKFNAQSIIASGEQFDLYDASDRLGQLNWSMCGLHNVSNALAAIAAAADVGVDPRLSLQALSSFRGVKKRFETVAQIDGITLYEDFAHHPTAIGTTLDGLRAKVGSQRIIVLLQLGSRTMQRAVDLNQLAAALVRADQVVLLDSGNIDWSLQELAAMLSDRLTIATRVDEIVLSVSARLHSGDHVIVMSNKNFDNLTKRLSTALQTNREQVE